MKKENVYELTERVKLLLQSLNGITINEDIYKIHKLQKTIKEVTYYLDKCSLTDYEEYSILTKKEYVKMISLKKLYEEEKEEERKVEIYDKYIKSTLRYERFKKIRDIFKNA